MKAKLEADPASITVEGDTMEATQNDDANEKERETAEEKEEDSAEDAGSEISFKSEDKPTLNFPFLKDCGTDPLNAAHYFNLTLGGSMARTGEESHLKTLKQMFPVWYDPHHLTKQRMAEQLSISHTHMSPSYPSKDDTAFRASSTNLDPALLQDANSYSTFSSPRTQTTSSSFHFSNLPTPRLSYHSISSNARQKSSRSSVDESKTKSTPISPEKEDIPKPLTESEKRMNYDNYHGMGIAFKDGVNLFPHFQNNPDKVNDHVELDDQSLWDSSHFKNLPLGWSSEIMDSPLYSSKLFDEPTPTPKVLWRKAASAGTALRSFKIKSTRCATVADMQSLRPRRSQSIGTLQTISITPATPVRDPSNASNTQDRTSRSSGMSLPGRRSSVVDRLLLDVKDVSESGGGFSSIFQRRRRSSRRISGTSVFLDKEPKHGIIRGQALKRFRRVVRVIQIITNVCWTLKSYVREKDSTDWSFYELYLHLQNNITPNLFFDRQQFCKIEPPKGGRRLERLLTIPPYLRTPDKIQQILAFVRTHETFQHFPADAQVRFCQVMQYQSYDPRVVILKEGHPPSCFYLILSGTLMVNVRQTNPVTGQKFVQTVGMMEQGECFGEIALLEGRLRTASVVCKTRTELLVIYKEDFDRIVRKPLFQQRDENITCCISHQLFIEFPKEIFYTNPGHFFYQYFPKGSIISKNSNDCPFLILVKSGECQLLGSYKKFDSANQKQAYISRDVETLFPLYSDKKRAGTAKTHDTSSTRAESVSAITYALESTLLKERQAGNLKIIKPMTSMSRQQIDEIPLELTSTFAKHRSKTMSNVFDKLEKDKRMEMDTSQNEVQAHADNYWSSKLCGPRQRSAATRTPLRMQSDSKLWRVLNEDAKEFVQVATLKQGYVFGLEMLAGVDTPPLTVVSAGVECILVSKQLFLTHANIKSLRVAGDLVTTFPPSWSLKEQVSINRKWRDYKKHLVKAVVSSNA